MIKKKAVTVREKPARGRCRDCIHAHLMQSSRENPVIALCDINKERWVASMEPTCKRFEQRSTEEEIHPMIHLSKH